MNRVFDFGREIDTISAAILAIFSSFAHYGYYFVSKLNIQQAGVSLEEFWEH